MRNIYFFLGALLLVDGLFGVDVKVSVMKGDSVTLKHHTVIPEDDSAEWWFGGKPIAIKETGGVFSISEGDDVGFKDRLNVDKHNGSLTITNITTKYTGDYKLQISGKLNTEPEIFSVNVTGGTTPVSVKAGENITLDTGLNQTHGYDPIIFKFEDHLIALINKGTGFTANDISAGGRFKGRLSMPANNVSLNISNSRIKDSGFYLLKMISSSHTVQRNIIVTVSGVSDKQTPDPGVSPGAVAGIVVLLVVIAAVLAAGLIYYRRKYYGLQKQLDML